MTSMCSGKSRKRQRAIDLVQRKTWRLQWCSGSTSSPGSSVEGINQFMHQ
jgi:hypothetical protein